ncbi:MAG: hypothetical protein QXN08_01430 [Nitrososphaerales archaeon]
MFKIVLDHALPHKLSYLRVYAEMGYARLYLSFDSGNIQWFGKIEKKKSVSRAITDKEYFAHRLKHPIKKVLMEDEDEIVVETKDGVEERWLKPRWLLREARIKRISSDGR